MVSEHANPLAAVGSVDAGGQNVHVAALSTALAARGIEVVVYTRRDSSSAPRRAILADGVTVEHVDAGPPLAIPKDDLLRYMPEMATGLQRSWMRNRPDIVHAHYWMSGLASMDAAGSLGIPVVQTFHALGTVKRRYQGAHDTSPPDRIRCERSLAAGVDRIIATCRDEVAELRALGVVPERVSVVPCGVDTSLFSPSGSIAPRYPRRARLIVVGRLVERKGVDDVIAALAALPGAELVIAGGSGREQLDEDRDAARLAGAARAGRVADRVGFLGRVDHSALPALFRSSDVAVCPPWYEPFGIVPLEAMACQIPVVATKVGGLIDTVSDGITGLHVPPRDPAALAAAVGQLIDDPARRLAMGRAGRDRVVRSYQWADVAAATLDAYELALTTQSRSTRAALP
jgi:glycosyltransferase involved in cell wall biosynthesis